MMASEMLNAVEALPSAMHQKAAASILQREGQSDEPSTFWEWISGSLTVRSMAAVANGSAVPMGDLLGSIMELVGNELFEEPDESEQLYRLYWHQSVVACLALLVDVANGKVRPVGSMQQRRSNPKPRKR